MFGPVHAVTFAFSLLIWLLMAAWNTRAVALSMGYATMGALGAWAYLVYVISAWFLGHLGDRWGFKRPLALSFLGFAALMPLGLTWDSPAALFVSAGLFMAFFGWFYPSVEGLLSRMEPLEGVPPHRTTARFSLCWSSGNVVGMALGPWLIQRFPWAVFALGALVAVASALLFLGHHQRHGERLPGSRPGPPDGPLPDLPRERLVALRRGARAALFCGSFAFVGILVLCPRLLADAGVPLERVGLYSSVGNLAVFASFLVLLPSRFWIGRPVLGALLCGGVLVAYGTVLLVARTPLALALATALGGVGYALPYTFALFYGLHTPDADNARQGAIHEVLIGLSQGAGPLAAGLALSTGLSPTLLGVAVLVLAALSGGLQWGLSATGPRPHRE